MGFLNVGITKRCNLRCKMCDSVGVHNVNNVDMSYEEFEIMEKLKEQESFYAKGL